MRRWTSLFHGQDRLVGLLHPHSAIGCRKCSPVSGRGCLTRTLEKAKRGLRRYKAASKNAHHCIICVTPENVRSEWLYYESGVIAARGDDVLICPYLVEVQPAELSSGPLGQYQCTVATKADTLRLVQSLNSTFGDKSHHPDMVTGTFESRWSELEVALDIQSPNISISGSGLFISGNAKELLLEAVKDENGKVYRNRTAYGLTIATNGRDFVEPNNPRSEARWTHALKELETANLVEPITAKKEVYRVTKVGFDTAESASPKESSLVATNPELSSSDIISLLEEYLAKHKSQLKDNAFRFSEVDDAVGLPKGSAAQWLAEAATKFGYGVARKGDQVITFKANFSSAPAVFPPSDSRPRW
jgi:hypothetical protein